MREHLEEMAGKRGLDRVVVSGLAIVYVLLVLLLLPARSYPLMLFGAALVGTGVLAAAWALGPRPTPALSILLVSFAGAAVLVVPNFPAMGGVDRAAVPLGLLGSQVLTLLWLLLRWRSTARRGDTASLRQALEFAVLGAIGLSAIATIPIGIGLLAEPKEVGPLLWVYPAYFVGTASAAVFYWLLQGVSHRPLGRYLIGVLGGTCLYAAVAPVVYLSTEDPIVISELLTIALVAGMFVGPPVTFGIMDGESSR